MIYNRTISDVELAKQIREEKVKNSEMLSAEEIETLERGFVTLNTINRIESKQAEILSILNNAGYFNNTIITKSWEGFEVFQISDLKRIINNNKILKESFYVLSNESQTPDARYYYEDFNKIEKLLVDLEYVVNYMISKYKFCGTFNCGG